MSIHITTRTNNPSPTQHIREVAEKHELEYLKRLLAKTRREGPDGDVVRNWGEAAALACLIEVLEGASQ